MKRRVGNRLSSAWNAFRNRDPTVMDGNIGSGYSVRPDRVRMTRGNEKSIVTAIYNRIALDVASVDIRHCRLDEKDRYKETIKSPLNTCLTLEANIDQTGKAFMQDVVLSMLDEGCVAIVPIDTDRDPEKGSYDILSLRTDRKSVV